MSQSRDIKAGGATVYVGADLANLVKGLQSASKRLHSFGKSVSSAGFGVAKVGASIAAPILAAAKIFQSAGDQVNDMSQRVGVSAKTLSEMGYAAKLSGSNMEDLEAGFKAMAKSDAAFMAGSPDEKFLKIADSIAEMKNPMQQAAVAMKIFGKAGIKLLPMLKLGADGIAEMRQEAIDLGASISNEDAAAAGELGDAFDRVTSALKGGVMQVGAAVAPIITGIANNLATIISFSTAWIKENRGVFVSVLAIGVGVAALGVGLSAAGFLAMGIGSALAAAAATIAFLTSPLGVAVGLTIGLGAGLLYITGAFTELGKAGSGVFSYFHEAWAGFINLIGQGNLAQAFGMVVEFFRTTWSSLVNLMDGAWRSLTLAVSLSMTEAAFTVYDAWLQAFAGIEKAFVVFKAGLEMGLEQIRATSENLVAGLIPGPAGAQARAAAQDQQRKRMLGIASGVGSQLNGIDSKASQNRDAASMMKSSLTGALGNSLAGVIAGTMGKLGVDWQGFNSVVKEALAYKAENRLNDMAAGFGAGADMQGKVESVGTFSSSALGQLGASSTEKDIVDASKRTAQATEGILKAMKNDGIGGFGVV